MSSYLKIKLNGIELSVRAQRIGRQLWFKLNGTVYNVDINDLTENFGSRRGSKNSSPEQIKAPMPGKVTKVFISEGEKVRKAQALLVMEAMKMEYTLKCDIDGAVQKIMVQVGDQVQLGHMLIQLKSDV